MRPAGRLTLMLPVASFWNEKLHHMAPHGIRTTAFLDWDVLKSNFCVWQWNSFVFLFFLRLPTKLWGGWFVHGKQACAGTTAQSQGAGSDSSAANTLPAAPPHIRKYYKQRARSFNFTYTQACNCDHNCTASYLRNKLQLFKRCYICIFLWYFHCNLWEY